MGPIYFLENLGEFVWQMNAGKFPVKQGQHIGMILLAEFPLKDMIPGLARHRMTGNFKTPLPVGQDIRVLQNFQVSFSATESRNQRNSEAIRKNRKILKGPYWFKRARINSLVSLDQESTNSSISEILFSGRRI